MAELALIPALVARLDVEVADKQKTLCSCGQCENGVYESDTPDQGGLCDFCFSEWEFVPQHQTYVNGCHCDCDSCYRGRERLGPRYSL